MKNLTDLDTQQFWAEVEHEEIIKRIPVAVVVGLFSVVGIMGNFHILIVFSRNLNNFSTYHVMVSALAVSDLFVCATYLPVEITMVMKPFSFDYDLTCRLALLNSYVWGIWSAFLTVLIAVERYRRICYPVREQISCSTARKFCLVLFLIATFNAAPIGYIAGTHTVALSNDTNGYECFVSDDLKESYLPTGYFFFLLFEVLVLGFAIVLLYLPIRRAIQRSNTRENQRKWNHTGVIGKDRGIHKQIVEIPQIYRKLWHSSNKHRRCRQGRHKPFIRFSKYHENGGKRIDKRIKLCPIRGQGSKHPEDLAERFVCLQPRLQQTAGNTVPVL